jgi:hypothetical protein
MCYKGFIFLRFVQKVFELDPQTSGIPWQPRGYVSKRKAAEMVSFEQGWKKYFTFWDRQRAIKSFL